MSIQGKVELKAIGETDLPLLFAWRNQNRISEVMFNSEPISYEEHVKWYKQLQKK